MKLYPQHCGPLELKNRFVQATHPDGTVWIIPASTILDRACAYYEANGWYDEDEEDSTSEQPRGDDLLGLLEVNADIEQESRECRWSRVGEDARLSAGPGTIPPDDDRLWWFEESGGNIIELTDVPESEQHTKLTAMYWFDDFTKAILDAQVSE